MLILNCLGKRENSLRGCDRALTFASRRVLRALHSHSVSRHMQRAVAPEYGPLADKRIAVSCEFELTLLVADNGDVEGLHRRASVWSRRPFTRRKKTGGNHEAEHPSKNSRH